MTKTSKSSKKKEIFNVNDIFYEEIPDNEVRKQKYKEDTKQLLIVRIFIILAIALFGYSIYYAFMRDTGAVVEKTKTAGDLFMVHSSADFGDVIESFNNYTAESNAKSYKFYVENNQEIAIKYKLKIEEKIILGKNKIDGKNLRYSLIKNGTKVATGLISELNNNIVFSSSIESKSKDNYIIKFWAIKQNRSYYKYKIALVNWEE